MKKINCLIVLILCVFALNAQSDCEPYIPVDKGAKWEMTNYNAKGKPEGHTKYELTDKTSSGNEDTYTVQMKYFDKKGEETFDNSFTATCSEGKFKMDMRFMMNTEGIQSFQDAEMEIDATNFELPTFNEAAGTTLEDGSMTISMGGSIPINMNMTVLVTDRKVEAKESITTPAGTFDCIVIAQKVSTKMMMKVESSSKEWYAPGVGLIRSESYSKKGKLMSFTELTKLEK